MFPVKPITWGHFPKELITALEKRGVWECSGRASRSEGDAQGCFLDSRRSWNQNEVSKTFPKIYDSPLNAKPPAAVGASQGKPHIFEVNVI